MPGIIIASTALVRRNETLTDDDIREGLSGNLCRCSGYIKVIEAVRTASGRAVS